MARKPKAEAANDDRLKLLNALAFASIAIEKADEGKSSFVAFRDRWLTAENDTVTLGIPVDIDLELCPQADKFKAALQQCGQQFQLTQVDTRAVSLKSGNFRALVAALPIELAEPCQPDPPCAVLNESLNIAFEACSKAMSSKGDKIYHKSVLLRAGSIIGTNGGIAIESWHGIDLPGPIGIPKKAVDTLLKVSKPLCQFGFSANSVTFYFDDGSFLKTRVMSDGWPDVDRLFYAANGPFQPIWPTFFVALKAIEAFVQNDSIFFHDGFLATHNSLELGASYRVDGLPGGYTFSAAYWRLLEPIADQIAMAGRRDAPSSFIGKNIRGLLMGKSG